MVESVKAPLEPRAFTELEWEVGSRQNPESLRPPRQPEQASSQTDTDRDSKVSQGFQTHGRRTFWLR